jgi:hypothetical protein
MVIRGDLERTAWRWSALWVGDCDGMRVFLKMVSVRCFMLR